MEERTYVMLKPDAVRRRLAGEIIRRIEQKGYRIAQIKTMHLTRLQLQKHYSHIAQQPFYSQVEEYMMSGPVIAMIVEGEHAVSGVRILMGKTRFEEALPGSIRGDFAQSTTRNVIHASDSPEAAEVEIERFFGKHGGNEVL